MLAIRFHGRGGQGAKMASRIMGTAGSDKHLNVWNGVSGGDTDPRDEQGQDQKPAQPPNESPQ